MMDETNGNGKFQREMTTASGNGESGGGGEWRFLLASDDGKCHFQINVSRPGPRQTKYFDHIKIRLRATKPQKTLLS